MVPWHYLGILHQVIERPERTVGGSGKGGVESSLQVLDLQKNKKIGPYVRVGLYTLGSRRGRNL